MRREVGLIRGTRREVGLIKEINSDLLEGIDRQPVLPVNRLPDIPLNVIKEIDLWGDGLPPKEFLTPQDFPLQPIISDVVIPKHTMTPGAPGYERWLKRQEEIQLIRSPVTKFLPVTDLPVTKFPVTKLPVTELPVTELPGTPLTRLTPITPVTPVEKESKIVMYILIGAVCLVGFFAMRR